ncbi:hypothetical protein VFPPC_17387 [Pochonia chlamydosporia 170]|uniref:Uncharacterized protein n=1 Tax=Pochonia chlamydosporia 170 TaxID=1380566 RepID=A0A219AT47_METCM|nr:hypothetical protein VFPPC_17387 [Pochonia chlamydosporia 170]OWT43464.1 hypothetical protein VFPPC_17387 [Pochonia chlamydosporia 170]
MAYNDVQSSKCVYDVTYEAKARHREKGKKHVTPALAWLCSNVLILGRAQAVVGHGPGHDPCRSAKGRNSGGWDNVKTWESTSLWSGLVWCGVVQPGRGERLQLGPPEPALTVNGSNGGAHWATFQLSLMKCRKMIVSLLPLMQRGNFDGVATCVWPFNQDSFAALDWNAQMRDPLPRHRATIDLPAPVCTAHSVYVCTFESFSNNLWSLITAPHIPAPCGTTGTSI